MGVAKDEENIQKKLIEDGCTNYLFFEATGSISVDVNGPFEGVAGFDPFTLEGDSQAQHAHRQRDLTVTASHSTSLPSPYHAHLHTRTDAKTQCSSSRGR